MFCQRPGDGSRPLILREAENEYFADGMTEEVINTLGQIRALRVAARTSSFAFKGRTPDVSEVAEKLRVATVLTGSVRKAGGRFRISVALVNASDGFQIWSERYDRQAEDVAWFERAYRERDPLPILNFWPAASPELAADPRFSALMTRVGVRSRHRASSS